MKFQEILKKRRKELNYTLKELANMVGVTEATVQRWESGNIKTLRHERVGKLANALEISPAVLMGWAEEPANNSFSHIPSNLLPLTVYNMEGVDGAHTVNLNMDNFKEINDLIAEVRDLPPEKIKAILQLVKTLK